MSEKKLQQQRNDKHRKLVRSPEKLSPCDLDPSFNPSFLSTSMNLFTAVQSNSRSLTSKSYTDQFPPHHQQVLQKSNLTPIANDSVATPSSFPPSTSTPSIDLQRKPSITIKYSKDEAYQSTKSPRVHQSSLAHHQEFSKSIDLSRSTISAKEHADQIRNNFLSNFSNESGSWSQNSLSSSTNQQQRPGQHSKVSSLIGKACSLNTTAVLDNYQQKQQNQRINSPNSHSLNLNLINQPNVENFGFIKVAGDQKLFNSNNPFLNDTFEAIPADEDEGEEHGGSNLFNVDVTNESELLFCTENAPTIIHDSKTSEMEEEQLLKNKREKFSNASTMKICLVVSPPINKLFHVSMRFAWRPNELPLSA